MGRLRNAWDAITGKGLFSGEDASTDHAGGLLRVLTGTQAPRRGTRELLQAYKRLPYLHSIVRRIAEDVAAVPWTVYAARGKGAKALASTIRRASGDIHREMVTRAVRTGDLVAVPTHPFLDVLESMNPALGGHDSWTVTQIYLDLIGQAPLVIEANGLGQPVELWPVAPHWIAETPRPGFPYYRASYGAWQRVFPEEAVLWLRAPDPENPYARGTSYGEALGDEFDVDELRARYAKNFFHNHATPDAIVALKNSNIDNAKLLKNELESKHRGARNAGVPLVTAGEFTYQQLQQTWREMQLSEQRAEGRRIVQEVLNFPPELMGVLDASNRSTIDAANFLYTKGCVRPRKERQRSALQPMLSRYDERLVLGFVNPVPEDEAAHRAHMVAVPTAFTVDEQRAAAGRPALPDGNGEELFAPPAAAPAFPVGLSAGDPPWAKSLPRGVRKSSEDAMRNALEGLRPERLTDALMPVTEEEFQRWGQKALADLGISGAFDMRNPRVRDAIEAAGLRIQGMNETTRNALTAELQEGVFAGEGIRELAKRVDDVFDAADSHRAQLIARTEVVGMSNAANLSAWHQSGVVEGKEWLTVRDGNARDSHQSLDMQKVGLDQAFVADNGHKAQHPGGFGIASEDCNCFPGDTVIESPTGTQAVFRRWYSGQMVEVETVGGYNLTGTPNHPVLTQRGWVPLGLVNEADNLFCGMFRNLAVPLGDDVDGVPTTAAEVFNLAAVGGTTKWVKPGSNEQFHGDGMAGNVDVVSTNGELERRLLPAPLKRVGKFALTAPELSERALSGDGSGLCLSGHDAPEAPADMGGVGEGGALGSGEPSHAEHVRLAPASHLLARGDDKPRDGAAGDGETLGDGKGALASPVGLQRVSSVRVFEWAGHVYNLQTDGGWYIANGVTVHNCRCAGLPVVNDPGKALKAMSEDERVAVWKRYDRALVPWETRIQEAARRAFAQQRADVLAALNRG